MRLCRCHVTVIECALTTQSRRLNSIAMAEKIPITFNGLNIDYPLATCIRPRLAR